MDGSAQQPPLPPPPRGMSLAPQVRAPPPPAAGLTRARPASADTRLRQKPEGGQPDFFAALGVEAGAAPARRGASFTAGSNRSLSNITMRTTASSATTSTASSASSGLPSALGAGGYRSGYFSSASTATPTGASVGVGGGANTWRSPAAAASGSMFGSSSLRSPAVGSHASSFGSGLTSPAVGAGNAAFSSGLTSPAVAGRTTTFSSGLTSPSVGARASFSSGLTSPAVGARASSFNSGLTSPAVGARTTTTTFSSGLQSPAVGGRATSFNSGLTSPAAAALKSPAAFAGQPPAPRATPLVPPTLSTPSTTPSNNRFSYSTSVSTTSSSLSSSTAAPPVTGTAYTSSTFGTSSVPSSRTASFGTAATTRVAAQSGSGGASAWQTESSSISTSANASNSAGTGASIHTATTPASEAASTDSHTQKPAQLFSMDADEFEDDGWGCDSPSAVLSNPMEESERVAVQSAAKEDDEFGWAEDDFAMDASTAAANQEVKQETAAPVNVEQTATSANSITSSSAAAFSTPSIAMETTTFQSTSTSYSVSSAGQVWSPSRPSLLASNSAQGADSSVEQEDQTDAVPAFAESKTEESRADGIMSTEYSKAIAEEFQVPTVDTPTAAAAAGDFWEDEGGDDDLFDHDDHADEEWDETIREPTLNQGEVALQSGENPPVSDEAVTSSTDFAASTPNQEDTTSFVQEPVFKENESALHESSFSTPTYGETSSLDASCYESAAQQGWSSDVALNDSIHSRQDQQSGSIDSYAEESSLHFHHQQTHGVSFAEEQSVATFEPESTSHFEHTNPHTVHQPVAATGVGNDESYETHEQSSNTTEGTHGDSEYFTKSSVSWEQDAVYEKDTEKSHEEVQVASEHVYPPRKTLDSEDACDEDGNADEYRGDSVSLFSGGGQSFSSFSGVSGRGLPPYGFQSSTEPGVRDMDGSSIRSFGVSSAGATFGGSERVSESAYSDGTASETPSIVDSSNASTAFGTDFPSVSEGQFSAPGTTFGGSDNVSDGQFSDGNASETTSVSESTTHTMTGLMSEYQPSTGHYVTETIVESPNPFSRDSMDGEDEVHEFESADINAAPSASSLFGSASEVPGFNQTSYSFSSEANASDVPSRSPEQGVTAPEPVVRTETNGEIQSAASLFGSSDTSSASPFGNFAAAPTAPTPPTAAPMVVEHDLPTSDASDLFGSSSGPGGDNAFGGAAPQASSFGYSNNGSFGQSYQSQEHFGSYAQSNAASSNHTFGGNYDTQGYHHGGAQLGHSGSNPFERQSSSASAHEMYGGSSQQRDSADAASLFASSAGSTVFEASRSSTIHQEEHSYHGAGAHNQGNYVSASASSFFGGSSTSQGRNDYSGSYFDSQHAETPYGGASQAQSAGNMFASGPSNFEASSGQSAAELFGSSAGYGGVDHSYNSSGHSFQSHTQSTAAPELSRKESASSVFSTQSAHSTSFDQVHHQHQEPPQQQTSSYSQPPRDGHNGYETNEFFYATSRQAHQATGVTQGFGHGSEDAGSFFAASSASQHDSQQAQSEAAPAPTADSFFGQSSSSESSTSNWFGNAGDNSAAPPAFQRDVSDASSSFDEQRHIASAQSEELGSSVDTMSSTEIKHGASEFASAPGSQVLTTEALSDTQPSDTPATSFEAYDSHKANVSHEHRALEDFSYGEQQLDSGADAFSSSPPGETSSSYPVQTNSADLPTNTTHADVQNSFDAQKEFEDTGSNVEHAAQWSDDHQQQQTVSSSLFDSNAPADDSSPFGNSESSSSLFAAPPPQEDGFGASQPNDFFASGPPANDGAGFYSGGGYGNDAYAHQTQQQQFSAQAPAASFASQSSSSYNGQEHYGHVHDQQQQFQQQQYQHHDQQQQYQEQQYQSQQYYEQAPVPQSQQQEQQQYQVPQAQQDQAYTASSQSFDTSAGRYAQGYSSTHATQVQQFQQQPGQVHQFPSAHTSGVSRTYGRATFNTGASSKAKASASPLAAATSGVAHSPMVKTSTKYKDPSRVAPSCLVAFGFGGNVATMFPKRKLLLNIAGSSFRNSPRPAVPSQMEHNSELRKGPVGVYRMEQLHPKDDFMNQLEKFPGPLTDSVSDDSVLQYLESRLAQLEANGIVDEDERLLLGVLRVLVKCNGRLSGTPASPGTPHTDPNSPEAMLIELLRESDNRRQTFHPVAIPAPRLPQTGMHPDVVAKSAAQIRELLLAGDRMAAVEAAMAAHMWAEALLLATSTTREEYMRVVRAFLDAHYSSGDPTRALLLALSDQKEKSVQEPQRLLHARLRSQSEDHGASSSLILSAWVRHAQMLIANASPDTSTILIELGDRLWTESNAVAAAHTCYLLAGIGVEAPSPTAKMALLGADHRSPAQARFYVSASSVQRTEVYEWSQRRALGSAATPMLPFQGYKLIHAMVLADHGKLETAYRYVSAMLTVIRAITATMKPGTSMYLEGMQNQLTVLDDRLRQHLGQDRIASVAAAVAASNSRGAGSGGRQGKWGLGSMLRKMGNVVNSIVEGGDAPPAAITTTNASTASSGLFAGAAPGVIDSPSSASTSTSAFANAPGSSHGSVSGNAPGSSRSAHGFATQQQLQPQAGSGPMSGRGENSYAAPPAHYESFDQQREQQQIQEQSQYTQYGQQYEQHSLPADQYTQYGQQEHQQQQQQIDQQQQYNQQQQYDHQQQYDEQQQQLYGQQLPQQEQYQQHPGQDFQPYEQHQQQQQQTQQQQLGVPPPSGPYSNSGSVGSGPPSSHGVPAHQPKFYGYNGLQHQQPPRSNDSRTSNGYGPGSSSGGNAPAMMAPVPTPPLSSSSASSASRFQKPHVDLSGDAGPRGAFQAQEKALADPPVDSKEGESKPTTKAAALASSGPASDKGKASPKHQDSKKSGRSKTPPPSGSKSGGWLSGLSSLASGFIASKMNPDAKVAKLGEQMEAYFDEEKKRWVFPGETETEEPSMPSAPPIGPLPGSTPASMSGLGGSGPPPPSSGPQSAPGSMAAASDDPLAALMAPPPMHAHAKLMQKDPLAAMMAPPPARGMYGAGSVRGRGIAAPGVARPRPQFKVFKPVASSTPAAPEGGQE